MGVVGQNTHQRFPAPFMKRLPPCIWLLKGEMALLGDEKQPCVLFSYFLLSNRQGNVFFPWNPIIPHHCPVSHHVFCLFLLGEPSLLSKQPFRHQTSSLHNSFDSPPPRSHLPAAHRPMRRKVGDASSYPMTGPWSSKRSPAKMWLTCTAFCPITTRQVKVGRLSSFLGATARGA